MLVTFTTKAYADITLFGDVALALLKMMGHSGTVPGAIRAEDVPEALDRLKRGIEASKLADPAKETAEPVDDTDEPPVSLTHRALPLIELFTAAARRKCDVMWK